MRNNLIVNALNSGAVVAVNARPRRIEDSVVFDDDVCIAIGHVDRVVLVHVAAYVPERHPSDGVMRGECAARAGVSNPDAVLALVVLNRKAFEDSPALAVHEHPEVARVGAVEHGYLAGEVPERDWRAARA